jgi:hypothetical protein
LIAFLVPFQDHGQGAGAIAGCILVDGDAIRVINRSTKYRNKFVHRRQSACVQVGEL